MQVARIQYGAVVPMRIGRLTPQPVLRVYVIQ